ncbi:MAG: hypothetical protein RR400_02540 [Clostridia bacterium]
MGNAIKSIIGSLAATLLFGTSTLFLNPANVGTLSGIVKTLALPVSIIFGVVAGISLIISFVTAIKAEKLRWLYIILFLANLGFYIYAFTKIFV